MKKLNLSSNCLYRPALFSVSIRIFPLLIFSLPILFLAACTHAPSDDGTTPPLLYPHFKSIEDNSRSGYSAKTITESALQPFINSSGKQVITGIPIPAMGKRIHPDSVAKPKAVKAGINPIRVNAHTNVFTIPENLKAISVDEGKLKKYPVGNNEFDFVLTNSFGDTIPSGAAIVATGKNVSSLFPIATPALPLRMKDNAIYDIQYLDVDQGMSSPFVRCILEDKAGNLWFGFYTGGVSRYDGKSFVHFTEEEGLSNNSVWCMLEDKAGDLWFGTNVGVSKYDGQSFVHFTEAEGLAKNRVLSIFEDKSGNLWFGTYGGGVCKYEPPKDGKAGTFVHFTKAEGLSDNYVLSILEDKAGNLWFGTENGGVSKYEPAKDSKLGTFIHFTEADGLLSNRVLSIVEDYAGNIWFGTNEGVNRYEPPTDGKVGNLIHFTEAEGLSNNRVLSILEDNTGNLWFGTEGRGVSKYDGKTFVHFTETEGLSNNSVTSILEDRAGNLWFGTNAGGVNRYDRKTFIHFTETRGLSNNFVRSMLEDKTGNLWFGTFGRGVTRYDGKNFTYFTEAEGLSNNFVRSILEDKAGNLWFGTEGGVSRYDGKHFINLTIAEGLSSNSISFILEDKSGNFWISTLGGGVSRYEPSKDGQSGTFVHFTETEGLLNNRVWSIIEDRKGNLWFGTESGGVSRYEPPKNGNAGTLINFTVAEGLSDNSVWTIAEDNAGNLWFDTQVGQVNENEPSKDSAAGIFINFTEVGGLSNNSVRSNLKDKAGNIWFGTQDKGVYKYNGKSFVHFTKADGLSNNIIRSILEDSAGNLWFGTQGGGACRFEGNTNSPAQNPPTVHLRQLIINESLPDYRNLSKKSDHNIKFDSVHQFENYPLNLKLPHNQNHLGFNFSAVDWAAPNKIHYSYRMLGLNNNWSTPSADATADFWNMPHGIFTFQIRAIGESRQWSAPFEYTFTIRRPWWLSAWAYTFYGLFLIAMVFLVDRIQRSRLILKEREKTKDREIAQAREIEKAYIKLKATQAQLIHTEKMASMGELTAGIAHEMQNPLNFVTNFSEVSAELLDEMKEELEEGSRQCAVGSLQSGQEKLKLAAEIADDVMQNLKKINYHGKRAGEIVKGMLQHSRNSSGQKELTKINVLADEYLRIAFHGLKARDDSFNAEYKTDFDLYLPKINVIPQDIGRVLLNLINNAFFAVSERSKKDEPGYAPTVTVTTKKTANSQLLVAVKDNGTGIPAHIVDKIFQPFFTTKPTGQGTGLGLSLSYDIIKAHGGELKVETSVGEGSEFIIHLPL